MSTGISDGGASTGSTPALGEVAARRVDVLDWRRRVRDLYEAVRSESHVTIAHAIWGRRRDELFATHPASPLGEEDRRRFRGLPVAPYDAAYRFVCELEPAEPHRLEVPTGTDGVVAFERLGLVRLDGLGTLDVWWLDQYAGGLFLPLRDASAGTEGGTYGGGRYLLDTVKGADLGTADGGSRLVVDLNFAYNPSCAYDPMWACPLPQEGNRLAEPVPVGELAPRA